MKGVSDLPEQQQATEPAGNLTYDLMVEQHKVGFGDLTGLHTRNRGHLNDGKMPEGPTRINGIVVADCNYKCVCVLVCVKV